MEIISLKPEEEFKATTVVINIFNKLHTNPKVLIQEFIWRFEIFIPNVLNKIYSLSFDYIISILIPFKRHLFVKIRCIIAELSALEVEQYPIHLL